MPGGAARPPIRSNAMSKLTTVLAVLALFATGILFHRLSVVEQRIAKYEGGGRTEAAPAAGNGAMDQEEEIEVAEIMGRMERHHAKWWVAGREGNVELAGFYLHELEEAMEELAEAHVVEDNGVDVSANMRTYGLPIVKELERKLKKDGVAAMHADADVLVATCNSCHVASGFPFIKVRVPSGATFPGQDLRP